MDPDITDKILGKMEYLDEMIRGECLNINKLNNQNKLMKKVDIVQRDVIKEKYMVGIEDSIMQLKMKIARLSQKNKQL